MRKLVYSIILIFLHQIAGAQNDESYVESRVDSAWEYLRYGRNIEKARKIARDLLEYNKRTPDYLAQVNAYQIFGESFYWNAPLDSAEYWYRRAYMVAEENQNKNEMAHSLVSLANLSREKGKTQRADSLFNAALEIRQAENDTSNILFILHGKAWSQLTAELPSLAMRDFLKVMEYAEPINDYNNMGQALSGIGVIHLKQKNYPKAKETLEKAIEFLNKTGDEVLGSSAMANLALVYKSMGNCDKSLEINEKLVRIFSENKYEYGLISIYCNMAICSNILEEYGEALEFAEKGLSLTATTERIESESDLLNQKALALLGLGSPDLALTQAEKSLQLANQIEALEKQRDARETLSTIYENLNNPNKALENYKAFSALNDSLYQTEKSRQVFELETLYQSSEKEKAIQKLEAQSEVEATRRKSLLGGIGGLLILSTLIINREVQRRKKARKLHEAELKLASAERARLEDQLEFKKRELTAKALEIARKNELLKEVKSDLLRGNQEDGNQVKKEILNRVNFSGAMDKHWQHFIEAFKATNPNFLQELTRTYPDLTTNEIRLCSLIKMNLSSADIAAILNISDEGVKKARYRLRKKLELNPSNSLEASIISIS